MPFCVSPKTFGSAFDAAAPEQDKFLRLNAKQNQPLSRPAS
jgi:hypothetical protein